MVSDKQTHVTVLASRCDKEKVSPAGSVGKELIARSELTSGLLLYFDQRILFIFHETSYMKQGAKYNGSLV
jgi:hypothetical protein